MLHEESSIEYASDFDRRPAIIVRVPRDLSRASLTIDDAESYASELRQIINKVAQELDDERTKSARIGRYQIGSAAEWSGTLAVVFDHAPVVLAIGADLMAYAQMAVAITKHIREQNKASHLDATTLPSGEAIDVPAPTLDLPVIVGLASSHFEEVYGPIDNTSVSWHVRLPGVLGGSVAHPVGGEIYTVNVQDGKERYIYIISAESRVIDHFLVAKSRVIPLDLPDWLALDRSSYSRSSTITGRAKGHSTNSHAKKARHD